MDMGMLIPTLLQNFTRLIPFQLVTIYSFQQGVKFRFGKDIRLLTQGLHFRWAFIEDIMVLSTVLEVIDLGSQSLVTKDGQPVCVGGAIEYEIFDLRRMWTQVQDFDSSVVTIAMGYATKYIESKTWDELHAANGGLGKSLVKELRPKLRGWGVKLKGFYLTDLAKVRNIRLLGMGGD